MELELQNTTDINSKDVIHKEPIFKEKNTLLFQDVLTNYTYKTYKGFPTTTGNDIIIDTNTISYDDGFIHCDLLTISDDTYKAQEICSYNLDSQGDIIDTTATLDGDLIDILNDPEGNYRAQVNGKTIFKCECPIAILNHNNDICLVEAHNVDDNINVNIYKVDIEHYTATNICTQTIPYDSKLTFYSNNAIVLGDTLFIGSDHEDQTKSGTLILNTTNQCYLPFMGRIAVPRDNNKTYIFGEPFPNIDTYTICLNKEIRFDIGEMPTICPTNSCMNTIYNFGYYACCLDRINSLFHCVEYKDPVSLVYAYDIDTSCDNINVTKCLIEPTCNIDHCGTVQFCGSDGFNTCCNIFDIKETTCRLFVNPDVTASPGESWTENCFLSCIITNATCNRGKHFNYNKYGTELLYNERLVTELIFTRTVNCRSSCNTGAFESAYYCLNMNSEGCIKCSAAEKMTNFGWNAWCCAAETSCCTSINESYPIIAGYCGSSIPTTEFTYCNDLKWIRTPTTVDTSRAWPKIQHTYDWNLADLNRSWKYKDLKVVTYHGIELGYSLNNVLLNNINFCGNAINVVYNDETILIPVNNTVYRYSKDEPLSIRKLSDFNFQTNAVVINNGIREDRVTGSLSTFPSSLSYIPEFEINIDALPVFVQPALGNTANDTLFVNAGYNVNMESKYMSTSSLLPSYQLGIFVPSDASTAMDQTIYGTLNTIASLVVDATYPICVYATHTLNSTSVDYLYTCSRCSVCIDTSMKDNTWWTDAKTNYFPISLSTPISNINSLSASVCLSQDYSASLATCDNAMMTVYNNSSQVYRSSSLFTIYGSNYYYDGQAVYYLGSDGTNQLSAYGIGLRYLAASSNEAYFFSEADRNIYSFSGSNTINKTIEAAAVGDVVDAMYDSSSQLLWILFTEGLYVMSSVTEESSFFKDLKGIKLLSNTQGITVERVDEPNISLSINSFDNILPLDLESEWIGMNDAGYKIPYFDILIFNDDKEHDIEITCSVLANGKIKEDKRDIHISVNDFDKGTFYRCRITPVDNNGNAAKIKIYSKDKVSIQGIIIQASEEYVGAGNI